ncbi:ABC transporter permease [Halostella sp. JP-L12]|uniref:ABC transporter permease n=1 Tax=Halostella TaxID=1843185 RepID=UPI000EF7D1B1|nr:MULTISPECIES: ABC transporter permease [Halostella]NHN46147.1 ABC transporter permease [Halostella sp. JP-L12]
MSRWSYFAKRLILSIPVILFGTSLTFIAIRMGPIDPVAAVYGDSGTAADMARMRESLGLNDPLWQQYLEFMWDMFRFELGQSWVLQPGTDTVDLILSRAPRTIWMGFWAVLIPLFIGIPLGFYAGLNPNTAGDYAASFGGIVWRAMPNFWLAVILMIGLSNSESLLFGFDWKGFILHTPQVIGTNEFQAAWSGLKAGQIEPIQWATATKQILPASIVLGSASMGNEMRIGRTAMLETKHSNYVEMAKAKGVSGRSLVWKHMFRNALIPLVPVITAEANLLLGGSVLIETVMAINGIGQLFFRALVQADLPVAGSLMYVFILLLVFINIMQDLLYTIIDPRVGYESE